MLVIGIDPALIKTGWALVKGENGALIYVASGNIITNTKLPMAERLKNIYQNINVLIREYKPDCFAIEETFVNNNPLSSLKLGQARGAALLSAAMNDLDVFEYSPNEIKKTVTGIGKAHKEQVVMMVKCLLPKAAPLITSEDEADALAIAICHLHHNFCR